MLTSDTNQLSEYHGWILRHIVPSDVKGLIHTNYIQADETVQPRGNIRWTKIRQLLTHQEKPMHLGLIVYIGVAK